MQTYYNYLGKELGAGHTMQPVRPEFVDDSGFPLWRDFVLHGDEFGFDVRWRFEDGRYIKRVVLPKGKRISRYGNERGAFASDVGTAYEQLSLPWVRESVPYHEYVVVEECEVECCVTAGVAAPGFYLPGGGVQYKFDEKIALVKRRGIIKEDLSWLRRV